MLRINGDRLTCCCKKGAKLIKAMPLSHYKNKL